MPRVCEIEGSDDLVRRAGELWASVSRALAEDLTHATDVHFDASDSMPQMMQNAFLGAVLEYLDAPSQLNVILRGLDQLGRSYGF